MIRLSESLSLIFFVFFFAASCKQNDSGNITIVWNNKQATGIVIPKSLLNDPPYDSISNYLKVRLENNTPAMLGEYTINNDNVLFKPLIPLSPGMSYEVFFRDQKIGILKIPVSNSAEAPALLTIYPTGDTMPENLLKLYLQFSAPMREGEALKHIALLDNHNDTLSDVFLDMQPELWNKERTTLTVWLDPGRIKRDLIPNRQMGNPLQKDSQYVLVVSNEWKDVQGLPLRQPYSKKFTVSTRDSISPQPDGWIMNLPQEETDEALRISFGESLDYFLLLETIQIVDDKKNYVGGTIRITPKETGIEFIPEKKWKPGRYRIQVASYLEDLAGNNLNRLFDRDIREQQPKTTAAIFEKEFVIGNLR